MWQCVSFQFVLITKYVRPKILPSDKGRCPPKADRGLEIIVKGSTHPPDNYLEAGNGLEM